AVPVACRSAGTEGQGVRGGAPFRSPGRGRRGDGILPLRRETRSRPRGRRGRAALTGVPRAPGGSGSSRQRTVVVAAARLLGGRHVGSVGASEGGDARRPEALRARVGTGGGGAAREMPRIGSGRVIGSSHRSTQPARR